MSGKRTASIIGIPLAVVLAAGAAGGQSVSIVIESRTVRPDDMHLSIRLDTDQEVAQTRNDVIFDPRAPIAHKSNLRPRCEVNPSIEKEGASFAFQPPGCTAGTCTAVRALILSLSDLSPIPSGSELYACAVDPQTPPGTYTFACANPGAKNPSGEPLGATCTDAEVTVERGTVLQAAFGYAAQGESISFETTMSSNESPVEIAADLRFSRQTPVRGNAGAPACAVADGAAALATFRFIPDGCDPAVDCTGVHAAVEAADADQPLASGAVLFACTVDVQLDAPLESFPLQIANGSGATASGTPVAFIGRDGGIYVTIRLDTPGPDPTPTPLRTDIEIGSANGAPGGHAQIDVTLHTSEVVGGIQNDLHFEPSAPIAATTGGAPACTFPPLFAHNSRTAFQPPLCTPGVDCTGIRAIVLGDPPAAIADGTLLYTCTVAIAADADAPASLPLTCSMHLGSDPHGNPLAIDCSDGAVGIVAPPPTSTPIPVTPTDTAEPAQPPVTGQRAQSAGSGGCQLSGSTTAGGVWLLIIPIAIGALRWGRRRGRRQLPIV